MTKAELMAKAEGILSTAEAENRNLTDSELAEFRSVQTEIKEMETDEMTERNVPAEVPEQAEVGLSNREKRDYSLTRAINACLTGDWSKAGLEREASNAIANMVGSEPRSFYMPFEIRADEGDFTDASNWTPEEMSTDFFTALRAKMVCAKAGAKVLTGLSGDFAIPGLSTGADSNWIAIGTAPDQQLPVAAQRLLQPKMALAYVDISRKSVTQTAAEQIVRADIANSLAVALDKAAMVGATNGPTGIKGTSGIGSVAGGTNGATLADSHTWELWSDVAAANADLGAFSYVVNPQTYSFANQTLKTSGVAGYIMENMKCNGFPVHITTSLTATADKGTSTGVCSYLIGGCFDQLVIGQFGPGVDILVDPYTVGNAGLVRVVGYLQADVALRQPASFSMMLDALLS